MKKSGPEYHTLSITPTDDGKHLIRQTSSTPLGMKEVVRVAEHAPRVNMTVDTPTSDDMTNSKGLKGAKAILGDSIGQSPSGRY